MRVNHNRPGRACIQVMMPQHLSTTGVATQLLPNLAMAARACTALLCPPPVLWLGLPEPLPLLDPATRPFLHAAVECRPQLLCLVQYQ